MRKRLARTSLGRFAKLSLRLHRFLRYPFARLLEHGLLSYPSYSIHIRWVGSPQEPVLGMVRDGVSPFKAELFLDEPHKWDQRSRPKLLSKSNTFCHIGTRSHHANCRGDKYWVGKYDRDVLPAPVDAGHPGLCPVCVEVYMVGLLEAPDFLQGRAA